MKASPPRRLAPMRPRDAIIRRESRKPMDRRTFLELSGATPLALAAADSLPTYRVVSAYRPADNPGTPGPYPGQVVSVHSPRSIDRETVKVDAAAVRQTSSRGTRALT